MTTSDAHERAVDAIAAVSRRADHGQLCPVWTGRARNVHVNKCDCWIRPKAAQRVAALAQAGLLVVPGEDVWIVPKRPHDPDAAVTPHVWPGGRITQAAWEGYADDADATAARLLAAGDAARREQDGGDR